MLADAPGWRTQREELKILVACPLKDTDNDHLVRQLSLELLRAVILNQCEHLVQTDARDTEDPKPITRSCVADGVRRTRPLHEHHPPQSVSHLLSVAVEHSRRHDEAVLNRYWGSRPLD